MDSAREQLDQREAALRESEERSTAYRIELGRDYADKRTIAGTLKDHCCAARAHGRRFEPLRLTVGSSSRASS